MTFFRQILTLLVPSALLDRLTQKQGSAAMSRFLVKSHEIASYFFTHDIFFKSTKIFEICFFKLHKILFVNLIAMFYHVWKFTNNMIF